MRRRPPVAVATLVVAAGLLAGSGVAASLPTPGGSGYTPPPVRHVFVINLENKGYAETFGPGSPAPYLSGVLTAKGQLLENYYGIAHHSLPNYLAQISGQGPNRSTQSDCRTYTAFRQTGTVAPGQAAGNGCVYPARVRTVANQLEFHGLTWRGYMEDMGRSCRHPRLGTRDRTAKARVGNQYAAKHNPFVYFQAITGTRSCARNDVSLRTLVTDLASVATTRNLSYITPNLCHDGHDSPCVDGRPGGLVRADRWLRRWVPKILDSPAFGRDGLLVITFDEAESDRADGDSAAACCGEVRGPNTDLPGLYGPGGGRTGTVVISPFITPGTTSSTPYNHYSLLATIEDVFGLPRLGYARRTPGFGADVFGATELAPVGAPVRAAR